MRFFQQLRGLVWAIVVVPIASNANELTLGEVEQLAISNAPQITLYQATAEAALNDAMADARLPDPKLKLGQMNLPISSFSFNQEPMTQLVIGIQQEMPPMGLLNEQREKRLLQAEIARAKAMEQALSVLRHLRREWMNVYYYGQAGAIIRESQDIFEQLVKITQYQYRAGRGQLQDVLRAQLEFSLLQDREAKITQQREAAIVVVEQWVGESLQAHTLSMTFPELPVVPPIEDLIPNVDVHPVVAVARAGLGVARKEVAIARARFKPKWMFDVSYSLRMGETRSLSFDDEGRLLQESFAGRADFLSVMLTVELPFFTSKKQDQRLNSRGHMVNAAHDAVEVSRRHLRRLLDVAYTNWVRLGERIEFYNNTVLPQAAQFSSISRKSYQSGVADFSELVRARIQELENSLMVLQLKVERAKAHYDLRFIAGEVSG